MRRLKLHQKNNVTTNQFSLAAKLNRVKTECTGETKGGGAITAQSPASGGKNKRKAGPQYKRGTAHGDQRRFQAREQPSTHK